jgi:hypothetical protein
VYLPKPYALQWTGGIVAIPNGLLVGIQRYQHPGFYNVPEPEWKTEVFHFLNGEFKGSVLLDSQWFLMDYNPTHGVLISGNFPVPHFVRVPLHYLLADSVPQQ